MKYQWKVQLADRYREITLDLGDLRPNEINEIPVAKIVEAIDRALKQHGIEMAAIVVTEQSQFRDLEYLD